MAIERVKLKQHLGTKYILVTSLERPTKVTMKESMDAVTKLSEENKCHYIIVDARPVIHLPSTVETYKLGTDLSMIDVLRGH